MIDFHNHILPNIDDGACSIEESLKMIKCAAEQGIEDIVNTVHFQHPKVEGFNITYNSISNEVSKLQKILNHKKIPIKIHIGSEVFYLPNLLDIIENPLATIGQGNYMLIEFPVDNLPESHRKVLFDLKMKGVTPIIAHPERYKKVQDNINIVYDWLQSGCLIQVTAASILGKMGKHAEVASKTIIKQNWCQILGSDAHNSARRNFSLKSALITAEEISGNDLNSLVYENPKCVIDGKKINTDKIENKIELKSYFWNKFLPVRKKRVKL